MPCTLDSLHTLTQVTSNDILEVCSPDTEGPVLGSVVWVCCVGVI